jgi:Skp family chaperone for outer membrane proteins
MKTVLALALIAAVAFGQTKGVWEAAYDKTYQQLQRSLSQTERLLKIVASLERRENERTDELHEAQRELDACQAASKKGGK